MKRLATVLFALLLIGGIVTPVTTYVHHSLSNKLAWMPVPPVPPDVQLAWMPVPPVPPDVQLAWMPVPPVPPDVQLAWMPVPPVPPDAAA